MPEKLRYSPLPLNRNPRPWKAVSYLLDFPKRREQESTTTTSASITFYSTAHIIQHYLSSSLTSTRLQKPLTRPLAMLRFDLYNSLQGTPLSKFVSKFRDNQQCWRQSIDCGSFNFCCRFAFADGV